MTKFQVYRKTLSFPLMMFVFDLLALALVVGGAFFGLFYLLFAAVAQILAQLSQAIIDSAGADAPEFVTNPTLLYIVVAAFLAIVLWSILQSVLVRPFILVGVLRNFMIAGKEHLPQESDFAALDKYPGFRKLRAKF